jgi:pimeloyl-ACP methyl ester carboxylesterase
MTKVTTTSSVEVEFTLSRVTLRGSRWGRDDAPLVLALHGWLDNANSFVPLMSELDISDLQVIAIDLPGHGYSDHYAEGYFYSLSDYILDIAELIRSFEVDQLCLLGHSLGGVICSLIAAAMPDKIDRLVLIDAIGPIVASNNDSLSHLRKAVDQFCHKPNRPKTYYNKIEEAINARMKGFGAIQIESARILVERGTIKTDQGILWRTDSTLRRLTPIRMDESQVQQLLQGIDCPTLLLMAINGFITEDNPRLTYIKNLQVEKMHGGHHFHMESDVNKSAQFISEFLKPYHSEFMEK